MCVLIGLGQQVDYALLHEPSWYPFALYGLEIFRRLVSRQKQGNDHEWASVNCEETRGEVLRILGEKSLAP